MQRLVPLVFVGVLGISPALAQTRPAPESSIAQDLKRLSIEDLSQLNVTSVSKRVERLSQTAAAISVIRQDDIRRTGVTTLAEAMRLADAVDVARSDGRTWNITARGFNIVTANKLLVLMDGRTLYSPLFSGTFWDVQDTVMADVDRIEVIRGPGGTIWGANAVNGVINVLTRDSSETRGTSLLIASGSENELITTGRYGARMGNAGNYRVYGKFRKQGANLFADGTSADDAMHLGQMGVRMDAEPERAMRWSIQGNAYAGSEGMFDRDDTDVHGGFVQAQVARRTSTTSELRVRADYDYTYRRVPLQFEEGRHTADVEIQQQTAVGRRHRVVLGGQFGASTARAIGSGGFFFDPERRTTTVASGFLQDEIEAGTGLFLTLGSKFEANNYTGLEIQPTARIRWSPDDRQTLWGAVSRAVRLPTRFDTDLRVLSPGGALVLSGNEDFESESVIAYEGGYRIQPHARLALDAAVFANRYDNLRSQEFPSSLGPVILLGNTVNAVTTGVETAFTAQILDAWRMHGSYSYLHKDVTLDDGSRDRTGGTSEGNDPPFLFTLRSYVDLPYGLELDAFFRHVDERPEPVVPAYSSLDLRLGWLAGDHLDVSLVGQNLLEPRHAEFGAPGPRRYEFSRGFYVRTIWRF